MGTSKPIIRGNSIYTVIQTQVTGAIPFYETTNASVVAYDWFWANADYAKKIGGDLATINTTEEQTYLNIFFGEITEHGFFGWSS